MANIEVIHNDAYEKLLETLGINWIEYLKESVLADPCASISISILRKYMKISASNIFIL